MKFYRTKWEPYITILTIFNAKLWYGKYKSAMQNGAILGANTCLIFINAQLPASSS